MKTWALLGRTMPLLSSADDRTATGNGSASRSNAPADSATRSIQDIIQNQTRLTADFERLIQGKSREALTQPDHDGAWGVVDILSHLLDWEKVTHDRVHRILNDDHPALPQFDDSLWSVEHNYRDNDPQTVLHELQELREVMEQELQDLEEEDWQRTAELEDSGEITLFWMLDSMCNHDRKHLEQARAILA